MRRYKCPKCNSTSCVIRQTKRGKSILYKCKGCIKYFSIKTIHSNKKELLNDHLDGLSFRKLGVKYSLSPMTAWRICEEELKKLPDNNRFTFNCCSRFSDIFVFDGKYFNVKGYEYDYVLLWGIDYFRHDIPIFILAPSENYQAWARYFSFFRIIKHYPQLVVCDDNANLKLAARNSFPSVKIQTCFNHFKENIRRDLRVRSDSTYTLFMKRIEDILGEKLNDEAMDKKLFSLYRDYQTDPVCLQILTNIHKYKPELLGYRGIPKAPVTTNMIEGLNSHLESRLFTLRSFQSLSYAKLWFNGYILKRRFTKFTDCRGKFRSLNGKTGVELTKKPEVELPIFF
ncbi:MAG: hypothetical protein A2857_00190 [Candidatus Levybacteria bacterium RIFCSPHIGHO2_01_FULL_36_15]|nr:MAG: hypothetical protein A2857_00190 [Candidatus Levybacteria bacterium RIFCSPHIGHO2_01_FULL_36_15]